MSDDFLCGLVEGFYGKPWSHALRRQYAGYLASLGLNTYLYCPKSDAFLRKRWREHWPGEEWVRLQELSGIYAEADIAWGVGLSPYELYRDYSAREKKLLRQKVSQLNELQAPIMAVLFDDMPGDIGDLAARQVDIIDDICAWSNADRIVICPTYYSLDPVLEQYFGAMPENYWGKLGDLLAPEVDIFWTGGKVCSESISVDEIRSINTYFRRPVTLWDNYPVNDGAVRSNHLYCQPLADRERGLEALLRGHLCNPMNQGLLSLPALTGLAALYGVDVEVDDLLTSTLGEATWNRLLKDGERFRNEGLAGMDADERAELARHYESSGDEGGLEVAGWLRGEYAFDPACLTD